MGHGRPVLGLGDALLGALLAELPVPGAGSPDRPRREGDQPVREEGRCVSSVHTADGDRSESKKAAAATPPASGHEGACHCRSPRCSKSPSTRR